MEQFSLRYIYDIPLKEVQNTLNFYRLPHVTDIVDRLNLMIFYAKINKIKAKDLELINNPRFKEMYLKTPDQPNKIEKIRRALESVFDQYIEEIKDIVSKYEYNHISISIEVKSSYLIVNAITGGLNEEYLRSLHVNPEQNISFTVVKDDNFKIKDVINAGLITYTFNRLENASLTKLIESSMDWILNPGKRCPNCDVTHVIDTMIPTICNKDNCLFIPPKISLINAFKVNPDMTDLLIALFYTACDLAPLTRIIDPYPDNLGLSRQQWVKVIDNLPSVENINKYINSNIGMSEEQFETYLLNFDKDIPYLIRWLYATNKIRFVPKKPYGPVCACKFVFEIFTDKPERQANFDILKSQHGSVLGYHGSDIYNYHSLLRNSLKNYSGTSQQAYGQVYGPGIYISPDGNVPFHYIGNKNISWVKSKFFNTRIILLTEVINDNLKIHGSNYAYVISDENHVRIRFLCLLDKQIQLPKNLAGVRGSIEETIN